MIKSESYKSGIVKSTILNVIAKGIGFINTLIIAYFFGAQIQTDLYYYIVSVATLLCTTINGIDLLVLIPEAMRLRSQESEAASQRFMNFFIWAYAAIGLVFAILAFASPVLFYSTVSKFDLQSLVQNKKMLSVGAIFIFFQLLNNLLAAILTSYKYFTTSIVAGLINSVFAILFTVFFQQKIGIFGTMIGLLIGYLINCIILVTMIYKKLVWDFLNVGWVRNKRLWQNIGLMQLNLFPLWIRNIIALYLLSGVIYTITALNLGQQICAIPEIFLMANILSVAGIKFSELNAEKKQSEMNILFQKLSKIGIPLFSIIASMGVLFSTEITGIIFENMKKINNQNLPLISMVICVLLIALPFKFISALSTIIINANQKIKETVFFALTIHTIITISIYFFIKQWGLLGYLIGLNMHLILFSIIFYYLFHKTLPFIQYNKIFKILLNNIMLNVFIALAVLVIKTNLIYHFSNKIADLFIGSIAYILIYWIVNELFNVNDFFKIQRLYVYANQINFKRKSIVRGNSELG